MHNYWCVVYLLSRIIVRILKPFWMISLNHIWPWSVLILLVPPICLNGKARDQKKQNILGATRLKKKRKNPPSSLSLCTLQCRQGRGEILFFRGIFQKCPIKGKNDTMPCKWRALAGSKWGMFFCLCIRQFSLLSTAYLKDGGGLVPLNSPFASFFILPLLA